MDMKERLRKATGKGIKIVVIDSGIDISHPLFENCKISKESFAVHEREGKLWIDNSIADEFGHGTAVCGILSKLVPEATLVIVKIFDESSLRADEEKLVYALQKVYNSIECDIVHFSLGIVVPSPSLQILCEMLNKKDVMLIGAYDNAGAISYPANYSEVIGVDSDIRCKNIDDFMLLEGKKTTILAKGGVQRLAWTEPRYIISQGTSFSAPYVTAYIAKMLSSGIGKEKIVEVFRGISRKAVVISESEKRHNLLTIPFEIKNAVLFPYNKEMHGLVNYAHQLDFQIKAVCDSKYTGRVGTRATSLDGENTFTVQNIEEVDWQGIDTLVLGHMDELDQMKGTLSKKDILHLCLSNQVNVYSFDNHGISEDDIQRFKREGLYIYIPQINDIAHIRKNMGKMYQYGIPIIAVFGTTSQQGKFTLQLAMRYRLLELGYNVAQIGTEPSALLYGCDACFPFGHNGTVNLTEGELILALNSLIHEVEINKEKAEILLVGSQSGTVPIIYNHINQMTIREIVFLMGVMPDAVILCVNADDDINLIKRTISAIEGIGDTKVVALAMYPLVYANGWQQLNQIKKKEEHLDEIKAKIEGNVNRPVYLIGDEQDLNMLCEQCIDYLAGE